jgi:hypothetical protein
MRILYLTLRIKGYSGNFGNDTLAVKFKMNLLSILMSSLNWAVDSSFLSIGGESR